MTPEITLDNIPQGYIFRICDKIIADKEEVDKYIKEARDKKVPDNHIYSTIQMSLSRKLKETSRFYPLNIFGRVHYN